MFPSFKEFIHTELSSKDGLESKIKALIDGSNLIMFFEKKGDIFGTDEFGRMVFAQMKSPNKDATDSWADDATFMAKNLSNIARDGGIDTIIPKSDLKKIKIIDSEDAYQKLLDQVKKDKNVNKQIHIVSVKE